MERLMHIKTYIAAPIPPKYVAPRVEAKLGKRSSVMFGMVRRSICGTVEVIGRTSSGKELSGVNALSYGEYTVGNCRQMYSWS